MAVIVSELKELEGKKYKTVAECEEAEKSVLAEREKRLKKTESRKQDAQEVQDAYKALLAAKNKYSEAIKEAADEFYHKTALVRKSFDETEKSEKAILAEAEKVFEDTLDKFTKAHPEGYHFTIKNDDGTTMYLNTASMGDKFYKDFASNFLSDFQDIVAGMSSLLTLF